VDLNLHLSFIRRRHKYFVFLITYRISDVTGSISVNGVERDTEEFRKKSSYITQNCYLMDLLTTKETLVVAASFKLSPKVGTKKRNDTVG
jgi:ABC-type multidrug transport system ATPase subunit